MIKIGDKVKVQALKYKNFQGTIIGVENGMAKILVPTYYENKESAIVYEDIRHIKIIK